MTASYVKNSLVKEFNLRRHQLVHINRKKNVCQICCKMFSLEGNLRIAVTTKPVRFVIKCLMMKVI